MFTDLETAVVPYTFLLLHHVYVLVSYLTMPAINGTTNGSTAYGEAAADKIIKDEHKPSPPSDTSEEGMQLILQSFRLLIADLCQQFGMGKFSHYDENC